MDIVLSSELLLSLSHADLNCPIMIRSAIDSRRLFRFIADKTGKPKMCFLPCFI
jgi:hypothetical protein